METIAEIKVRKIRSDKGKTHNVIQGRNDKGQPRSKKYVLINKKTSKYGSKEE